MPPFPENLVSSDSNGPCFCAPSQAKGRRATLLQYIVSFLMEFIMEKQHGNFGMPLIRRKQYCIKVASDLLKRERKWRNNSLLRCLIKPPTPINCASQVLSVCLVWKEQRLMGIFVKCLLTHSCLQFQPHLWKHGCSDAHHSHSKQPSCPEMWAFKETSREGGIWDKGGKAGASSSQTRKGNTKKGISRDGSLLQWSFKLWQDAKNSVTRFPMVFKLQMHGAPV